MKNKKSQVVCAIELASAKAAIKHLCIAAREDMYRAVLGWEPAQYREAHSPTIECIRHLIDDAFEQKAIRWWNFGDIGEPAGKEIWQSELEKKSYLFFNPYLVGVFAAWVFLAIGCFVSPTQAIIYSPIFGFFLGCFYLLSFQRRAVFRLCTRVRSCYLAEQLAWRLDNLLDEHKSVVWQNLDRLFEDEFLKNACLDKVSAAQESEISPDYFIKGHANDQHA